MPAAASKAGKWSVNVCWCLTTRALLPLGWSSPVQPIPIAPRFPQLDRTVASHHGNSTRLTSSMCGGKKHKNRQFETSLSYTASLSPAWTTRPLRKQEQNHEVLCEPVPFFVSFLHSPETSRNHLAPCNICSLCVLHSDQVNHCPSGSQPHISKHNPENVCFKKHFLLGFQELFGSMLIEEKNVSK